jgi:hypothetical protein
MTHITHFYLQQAHYQIGIGERVVTLHLDYAGNTYSIEGPQVRSVKQIARQLLAKKHGVNFAYKFNDKMGETL